MTLAPEDSDWTQPRALGPKGARTRRRIMASTAAMLAARAYTEIKITDIARATGIAQPNFYTYFAGVDDVVLAIGEEISFEPHAEFLQPDWSGAPGVALAAQLVEATIETWRRHRGVLSIIGYLAEKRGGDFAALRSSHLQPFHSGFRRKIEAGQAAGAVDPEIAANVAAYECTAILGAVGERYELLKGAGYAHKPLVATTARVLHLIATGQGPDPGRVGAPAAVGVS